MATLFRVNQGRYRNQGDDVTLCETGEDGRPDWSRCEETKLLAVDPAAQTLRLRRARYGTQPRAFAARKAWAAAHVTEGPWVADNPANPPNLQWFYNFSPNSPRDRKGRSAADALIEEFGAKFGPGGELERLDGIAFDVLYWSLNFTGRLADVDGDGSPDNGFFDGINLYGIGQNGYLQRLRQTLGPDRILTSDGWEPNNQRAFGILNGNESEGWPALRDLAAAGATLIAIASIFNGLGRMFWGWVADKVGRIQAFRLILGTQVAVFATLMFVSNPWLFGILVCYILLCYGGGFGTMPSYVLDSFGAKVMPVVYGTILTAWSTAGIVGPQVVALVKDKVAKESQALTIFGVGGALLAIGLVIAFLLSNKAFHRNASA